MPMRAVVCSPKRCGLLLAVTGPKRAKMVEGVNNELRTMIRDLALRRESHDRRQLYWALIQAQLWTPVRSTSAEGHVQPADLHPLDREALGGLASYGVFTHEQAAEGWQASGTEASGLRLERIRFVDLLPLLIDAGAGSLYINPDSKFSGELYRHELETCLEGARKLAARKTSPKSTTEDVAPEVPVLGFWGRIRSLLP
jgi:hypothetical protein